MAARSTLDEAVSLPTLLETGALPVEELAALAWREGLRPRPIYQAHRWFARRFGSAFRALLTAAALPAGADFWPAYYAGTDWRGRTVLDPFLGGGTSLVEAQRLGATAIGVDVDPVACAVSRFEARAAVLPDPLPALERLRREVGARLAPFYQVQLEDGTTAAALHYFWVQVVVCAGCGAEVEAHPHYQLAHEAEGARQWAFCPSCHTVQALDRSAERVACDPCGRSAPIPAGPVRYGRLTCPGCGARERLIDVAARTGGPPRWRLFAVEYLEPGGGCRPLPLRRRHFRAATARDHERYVAAAAALRARATTIGTTPWVPNRPVPALGRADDRLPRYGYTHYQELFNQRQLLHLSLLGEAIAALREAEREALALALSDHLTTSCMMTSYAFGWRRACPLFTVRAFRHITRPVEVNPWLDGTGRGTFPNAVRQVSRAIAWARAPREPLPQGGFRPAPARCALPAAHVYHADARRLAMVADSSVDFVLTDPPYLDNVAYSELADFFVPWLEQFGLAPRAAGAPVALRDNLAARARSEEAAAAYSAGLAQCFAEVSRALKPAGRLVFTYQHHAASAWLALAHALAAARLRPLQVFPLLGDARGSLHAHAGNSRWDAVFVMGKARAGFPPAPPGLALTGGQVDAARRHCGAWAARLAGVRPAAFRRADAANFLRACLAAAALGLFDTPEGGDAALATPQPANLLSLQHVLANLPELLD